MVDVVCKALEDVADKPDAGDIVGVTGADVTRRVDRIAEEEAVKYIQEEGMNALLVSEESPPLQIGSKAKTAVILDPLDGSTNFVRKIPFSSVSAALAYLHCDDKTLRIRVGVVKDVNKGDTYYARDGGGAYLNGSILQKPKELSEARPLISAYTYDGEAALRTVKLQSLCNIRSFGSIALELSYLAASKLDGVIDVRGKLRLQDIAAGKLILEESGGAISDDYGRPLILKIGGTYSIVASNTESRLEWLVGFLE